LSKKSRADNIKDRYGAKDVKRIARGDITNDGGRSNPNTEMKEHTSARDSLIKAIGMRVLIGGKSWEDIVMKTGRS
jgi:hypothetical protein